VKSGARRERALSSFEAEIRRDVGSVRALIEDATATEQRRRGIPSAKEGRRHPAVASWSGWSNCRGPAQRAGTDEPARAAEGSTRWGRVRVPATAPPAGRRRVAGRRARSIVRPAPARRNAGAATVAAPERENPRGRASEEQARHRSGAGDRERTREPQKPGQRRSADTGATDAGRAPEPRGPARPTKPGPSARARNGSPPEAGPRAEVEHASPSKSGTAPERRKTRAHRSRAQRPSANGRDTTALRGSMTARPHRHGGGSQANAYRRAAVRRCRQKSWVNEGRAPGPDERAHVTPVRQAGAPWPVTPRAARDGERGGAPMAVRRRR